MEREVRVAGPWLLSGEGAIASVMRGQRFDRRLSHLFSRFGMGSMMVPTEDPACGC